MKRIQLLGYATFIGAAVGVKIALLISQFTDGKMVLSDVQFGLTLGALFGFGFSMFLIYRFKNIISDSKDEQNSWSYFLNNLQGNQQSRSFLGD